MHTISLVHSSITLGSITMRQFTLGTLYGWHLIATYLLGIACYNQRRFQTFEAFIYLDLATALFRT